MVIIQFFKIHNHGSLKIKEPVYVNCLVLNRLKNQLQYITGVLKKNLRTRQLTIYKTAGPLVVIS